MMIFFYAAQLSLIVTSRAKRTLLKHGKVAHTEHLCVQGRSLFSDRKNLTNKVVPILVVLFTVWHPNLHAP